MPHGMCYMWKPTVLFLHVSTDIIIALSYLVISLTLVVLTRKARKEIPFHWMFLCFGSFIVLCGMTHLMEVITVWNPVYWFSGFVKACTAAVSLATAIALPPLIPKILLMIQKAKQSEEYLKSIEIMNRELESKIQERTFELELDNAKRKDAEEMLRLVVESAPDGKILVNGKSEIVMVNKKIESMFGYSREELFGKTVDVLLPERLRSQHSQHRATFRKQPVARDMGIGRDLVALRKDGSEFPVEVSLVPITRESDLFVLAVVVDIAQRKKIEQQLRDSQRLESIGLLAGGVAHDFNNLLSGVLMNASLALDEIPTNDPKHVLLENVVNASKRATDLTKQLLAYAGKGTIEITQVNLSKLVQEINVLVKTSMPKGVETKLDLMPNLPEIDADTGQIQQLIMNLVINAGESFTDNRSGVVRITTRMRSITSDYIEESRMVSGLDKIVPGDYVDLEVQDNGCGMPEKVKSRIFDPFFTTKFAGRGLGLAAVLGIVKAHRGAIWVYSEIDKGTCFKILFPVGRNVKVSTPLAKLGILHGNESILIVDDEEIVAKALSRVLEHYGYHTRIALDGMTALEMLSSPGDGTQLVILDMMMPKMSGDEVFRRARELRPGLKILVTSGYNEAEAMKYFNATSGFIQKPYTSTELANKVRSVLDD